MRFVAALKPPSALTLRKYGLTVEDWQVLAALQGGVCFVCQKVPTKGRLCIDHEHVPRWKKLKPAERRLFVRGLLCWFCNHHYVGRCITIDKAHRVVAYLERHQEALAAVGLSRAA